MVGGSDGKVVVIGLITLYGISCEFSKSLTPNGLLIATLDGFVIALYKHHILIF